MISHQHKTVPIQVWVDVDEGIAETVKYLNTIPGVQTYAWCQRTIGEGGAEPYGPQVMVSWTAGWTLARLAWEFDLELLGECFAYVRPLR